LESSGSELGLGSEFELAVVFGSPELDWAVVVGGGVEGMKERASFMSLRVSYHVLINASN
jgi:hypothetical protein